MTRQFHELAPLDMPEQNTTILRSKGPADDDLLLHELVPQFFVIGDQLEAGRQAEVMAVRGQEFDAETVNGTEERSIECFDYLQRKTCFENLFPGALLHLVCRAIGVGDDDQLG